MGLLAALMLQAAAPEANRNLRGEDELVQTVQRQSIMLLPRAGRLTFGADPVVWVRGASSGRCE